MARRTSARAIRARPLGRVGLVGPVALALALALAPSCKDPTQVLIEVRTNLAYRSGLVTSFTVGGSSETEGAETTTESREPWGADGFVGSLTVVPGSSKDARLGVRVVLGVDRDARSCTPPKYEGCVVARRSLRYTPNEKLRLPIALYARCKNVPCDTASTCNVLGQCVASEIEPATCGSELGCVPSGDSRAGDPVTDGGSDGRVDNDGAAVDGPTDGPADGSADAPTDASRGGTPGKIDCKQSFCDSAAGQKCCFDSMVQAGACVGLGSSCPIAATRHSVACDGEEDCPNGQICCVVPPGNLSCNFTCGNYKPACHSTKTCAVGMCVPTVGGYFWGCQ